LGKSPLKQAAAAATAAAAADIAARLSAEGHHMLDQPEYARKAAIGKHARRSPSPPCCCNTVLLLHWMANGGAQKQPHPCLAVTLLVWVGALFTPVGTSSEFTLDRHALYNGALSVKPAWAKMA